MLFSKNELEFYEEYVKSLVDRCSRFEADDKSELEYKVKRLINSFHLYKKENSIETNENVLQLAHELESFLFLNSYGRVKISSDSKHEAGPDYLFQSNVYIECVCSSIGNTEKSGINEYLKFDYQDYAKKRNRINERITNSLYSKADFYKKHLSNGILQPDYPYVIFLSLGRLVYDWFEESYGMALTDVLIGRGKRTYMVDMDTGEILNSRYDIVEEFQKWNGSPICSKLFFKPEFKYVSGVLLAVSRGEEYTCDNTFFFLNPFSKNEINTDYFNGIVYWKVNAEGYYQPYQNGKSLAHDI